MIRALGWVLRRDLMLAFRRRGDVVNALVFFVIVVSLFPLGVGPEASQLRNMAPGVLWVAAHWLVSGLPLVLMAPLLGLQFDLPGDALAVLCV